MDLFVEILILFILGKGTPCYRNKRQKNLVVCIGALFFVVKFFKLLRVTTQRISVALIYWNYVLVSDVITIEGKNREQTCVM